MDYTIKINLPVPTDLPPGANITMIVNQSDNSDASSNCNETFCLDHLFEKYDYNADSYDPFCIKTTIK